MKEIHKKFTYRDCEINLNREQSLGGWQQWNWAICDRDGLEFSASFSESEDTLRDMIDNMKSIVDDYHEHPELYNDCEFCSEGATHRVVNIWGSVLYLCDYCYESWCEDRSISKKN